MLYSESYIQWLLFNAACCFLSVVIKHIAVVGTAVWKEYQGV